MQFGLDGLPHRPLGLHRGDRVDRVGPAQLVGRDVGQAQVAHQAVLHEVRDGADGVLQRDLRVGEVRVVQVDHVGAQVAQRLLGVPAYVAGLGVHGELAEGVRHREAVALGALGDAEAELGGDGHAVPAALEGLADDAFVVAVGAVAVGGVDQGGALVECGAQCGDGSLVVDLAVHAG